LKSKASVAYKSVVSSQSEMQSLVASIVLTIDVRKRRGGGGGGDCAADHAAC
jgi:hypothetical protein